LDRGSAIRKSSAYAGQQPQSDSKNAHIESATDRVPPKYVHKFCTKAGKNEVEVTFS